MNRIIRAFAAFIVSICLILAPSIQYANAASSWSITSAVSAGARTVVTATKSGYKSAVNIAPTAGRLGVKLIKMGRSTALVYAVGQLLDGVDWVLDPANNRIIYKAPPTSPYFWTSVYGTEYTKSPTAQQSAQMMVDRTCMLNNYFSCSAPYGFVSLSDSQVSFKYDTKSSSSSSPYTRDQKANRYSNTELEEKYLAIDKVAAKVISNASSGHADSQAATREVAIEMVVGGQFDADLLAGAVPTNDSTPLVPSVPISGNGNETYGGVPAGAVPGSQSGDAVAAAEAAAKAAAAAQAAADAAAEDARKAIDDAKDLINSDATDAERAAAQAAAEAAAQSAVDSKAASDAAAKAAADAAERAAKATADASKAAADAAAAAQAAADATDATDADKAAAADAAAKAEEAAKAAADAAAKAEEAAKARPKEKPFELPAFCSWATKVCDFVDWVKADPQLEEPDMTKPEIQDLNKYDNIDISQNYISATGQCPPAVDLNINFGLVKLSYEPLCLILDKLSGVIVAVAYISAGFMIVRTV